MNRTVILALAFCATALTAGCATTPPIAPLGARLDLPPYAAAEQLVPGTTVLWGGMIVEVRNLPDHSEIELLGYPLDGKMRPRVDAPAEGRYIAVMPGYVERFDWPAGRFLTLRGTLTGTREGLIDEKLYVYPVLEAQDTHLWPAGFQKRGGNFSFGVGVGIH